MNCPIQEISFLCSSGTNRENRNAKTISSHREKNAPDYPLRSPKRFVSLLSSRPQFGMLKNYDYHYNIRLNFEFQELFRQKDPKWISKILERRRTGYSDSLLQIVV